MLIGFVVTLGITGIVTSVVGLLLGPMGIALSYMVSMYISVVLEFIIPTMIFFAELSKNYYVEY